MTPNRNTSDLVRRQFRNVALTLEEVTLDILVEAAALIRSATITVPSLDVVLFDDPDLAHYCGMSDHGTVFLKAVSDKCSKHQVIESIFLFTRTILTQLKPHMGEMSSRCDLDGNVLIHLSRDPSKAIAGAGMALLRPLIDLLLLLPKLQIPSLYVNGFEAALVAAFRDSLLDIKEPSSPQFFALLRRVIVANIALFRILGIPRHSVARIMSRVFAESDSTEAVSALILEATKVCPSFVFCDEEQRR